MLFNKIVKDMKVNINKETGQISIFNDGTGIDVAEHPTEKDDNGNNIWIPSLIFGELYEITQGFQEYSTIELICIFSCFINNLLYLKYFHLHRINNNLGHLYSYFL